MNTQQLTLDFAQAVREAVGDNLAEVQRRNRASSGTCASHDFCDSNQLMIDALAGQGEQFQIINGENSDQERNLSSLQDIWIDNAWAIAKRCGFEEAKIREDEEWLKS